MIVRLKYLKKINQLFYKKLKAYFINFNEAFG